MKPDEPLSAELRQKLDEAAKRIEKEQPPRFRVKRGAGTALLCAAAFFAFGVTIGRATLGNSLGFAFFGAIVGFFVGACRPDRPKR